MDATPGDAISLKLAFRDRRCKERKAQKQLPRRHLTKEDLAKPRKVHLPTEVIEQIINSAETELKIKDMTNLRLVCRSFADGLLPLIVSNKELDVYLDERGMRDFEELHKSHLGPYIRKIRVGIRRIAHYAINIKQIHDKRPVRKGEPEEPINVTYTMLSKKLSTKFYDTSFTYEYLEKWAEFAGFTISDQVMGCELFEAGKGFRPSDAIIKRFVEVAERFPNIQSLISLEDVTHTMVYIKNKQGDVIKTNLIKLSIIVRDGKPVPRAQAHCLCIANDEYENVHFGYRRMVALPCKSVRNMARFFSFDLARFVDLIKPDAPIFSMLKEVKLNFLNKPSAAKSKEALTGAAEIATVLVRCENLVRLSLWTKEPHNVDAAGPAITRVLMCLTESGSVFIPCFSGLKSLTVCRWQAKLKALEISAVSPANVDVVAFLATQPTLKTIRAKKTALTILSSAQQLKNLWETLQKMDGLSLELEDFCIQPEAPSFPGYKIRRVGSVAAEDLSAFLKVELAHLKLPQWWT